MPQYSILVVDDEDAQRDALAGFLKKKSYQVFKAQSGKQALEVVNLEA